MNFDQKILVLENRIIDFLTMITWWTEVRWNKSNLHIAATMATLGTLLIAVAFCFDVIDSIEKRNWIFAGFASICTAFGTISLTAKIFFRERLVESFKRQFPQGFPNPCCVSKKHSTERRFTFSAFIIFYIMMERDAFGYFFASYLAIEIVVFFFLACDSLPPGEKARRIAKREVSTMLPEGSAG